MPTIKDIFLVATYMQKPKNPHMTVHSGYMLNPENIQLDEQVEFTKGLKAKHEDTAGVILNLQQKTVLRNKYDPEQRDFDILFKYFLHAYPKYVMQVMAQLDMAYLEQFIPKEEIATGSEISSMEKVVEEVAAAG